MMEWFGPAPFSLACTDTMRVETPTVPCVWCAESFTDADEGYTVPHCGDTINRQPWHVECWLRQLSGSVAHIERRCSCYVDGSDEGDAPNLTRRQAAAAAMNALAARRLRYAISEPD